MYINHTLNLSYLQVLILYEEQIKLPQIHRHFRKLVETYVKDPNKIIELLHKIKRIIIYFILQLQN